MSSSRFAACIVSLLTACSAPVEPSPDGDATGDIETPSDTRLDTLAEVGAAPQCTIEAPTSCPDPAPRWADVEPIFESRCVVCHEGAPGGPWPLTSYQHVADWQSDVRADVLGCAMPPPDSGVLITDAERLDILTWIRCGLPQ